jgi:hypothetical protein
MTVPNRTQAPPVPHIRSRFRTKPSSKFLGTREDHHHRRLAPSAPGRASIPFSSDPPAASSCPRLGRQIHRLRHASCSPSCRGRAPLGPRSHSLVVLASCSPTALPAARLMLSLPLLFSDTPDGLGLLAHTLGFIICNHVYKKGDSARASAKQGRNRRFQVKLH